MMYTQELQSTALSLLLRTPNGRHGVGFNREKWILNPGATSSVEMEMFAFLGKLMGIAMRSKDYLALNLPSIVWYVQNMVRLLLSAVEFLFFQAR